MKPINIKIVQDLINLEIDKGVYDLDTVKQAAYKFTDSCSFEFSVDDNVILVKITITEPLSNEQIKKIIQKFDNEILDQDLRKTIAKKTEHIRNVILANAFSNTNFIESE